jgi:hypothetical protein
MGDSAVPNDVLPLLRHMADRKKGYYGFWRVSN